MKRPIEVDEWMCAAPHEEAVENYILSLEAELAKAREELAQAKETIDTMIEEGYDTCPHKEHAESAEKSLAEQRAEHDGAVEEWLDALQKETGKVADGSLTLAQAIDEQLRILSDRANVEVCPIEDMKQLEAVLAEEREARKKAEAEAKTARREALRKAAGYLRGICMQPGHAIATKYAAEIEKMAEEEG